MKDPKPPNEVCPRCGRWPCGCAIAITEQFFAVVNGTAEPVAPPVKVDLVLSLPIFEVDGVPGSVIRGCDDCGTACWVAPSTGMVLQAHPEAAFACLECGERRVSPKH